MILPSVTSNSKNALPLAGFLLGLLIGYVSYNLSTLQWQATIKTEQKGKRGHVPLPSTEISSVPSAGKYNAERKDIGLPGIIEPGQISTDIGLPGILQPGLQKSGTTALAYFLHRAGVCLSRPDPNSTRIRKEPHFFNSALFKKGVNFYSDMFAHCDNLTFAMDATPNTWTMPRRVREIYDLAGGDATKKLKIIIVFREPVAKALSFYNHMLPTCSKPVNKKVCINGKYKGMLKYVGKNETQLRNFTEYADFKFKDNSSLYNKNGGKKAALYGDHFEKWLHYFDRRQILVLSNDELIQDEPSFLNRVASFLELQVKPNMLKHGTRPTNTNDGVSKVRLPPCDVQKRLSELFSPHMEKFYRLVDGEGTSPPMEQKPFPRFVLGNCTNE